MLFAAGNSSYNSLERTTQMSGPAWTIRISLPTKRNLLYFNPRTKNREDAQLHDQIILMRLFCVGSRYLTEYPHGPKMASGTVQHRFGEGFGLWRPQPLPALYWNKSCDYEVEKL